MRVAVIDCDSVMFSIGNGVKLLDEKGNPLREDGKRFVYRPKTEDELVSSADGVMTSILSNCNADAYIGYIKGENTTVSRKSTNPYYKANRPTQSPQWWGFCKNYLISEWGVHQVDYMEVDDAVNITRLSVSNSFIVAIDGDLLGLEGKHYNWRTNSWLTVTRHEAYVKFWKDMIVGQPGDNIKGLPGKGEAYFIKLHEQLNKANFYDLPSAVLNAYVSNFGEQVGIQEFYKNYVSLKIMENGDLKIPEPRKWANPTLNTDLFD